MRIPLRAAAVLVAVLLIPVSAAPLATPLPNSPTCRVTASYTPVTWPASTLPENRFRRITVKLRPDLLCPPNGVARVHLVNRDSGRRLPEVGDYLLTPARPTLYIPAAPPYAITTPGWEVYWRSASGKKLWLVPQVLFPPQGGDAR